MCLGRSENQDGGPSFRLAESFPTSPLQPLNRIQLNFTKQDLNVLYHVCVFGPIGKPRWPLCSQSQKCARTDTDEMWCWLVVLRIYVALAVFQPYRDLEAGDNQSLKFKWRGGELNPGPLAPQTKSLTTRPPPLPGTKCEKWTLITIHF